MSNFFQNFPKVSYVFGDNEPPVEFQDLSVYIDAIDQAKEYASFYQNYQIKSGERPDHVSFALYENVNYGWTFWLMNDHIRESGWPLDNSELYEKAQLFYPNVAFRTTGVYFDLVNSINNPLCASSTLVEGGYVWFEQDQLLGEILRIDQDLALLHVKMDEKPTETNLIRSISKKDYDDVLAGIISSPVTLLDEIAIVETYDQYDAPHHYENAQGERVFPSYSSEEPYPFDWNSVSTNESVSYFQRLREENDKARSIRVLKPDVLQQVISGYSKLLLKRR